MRDQLELELHQRATTHPRGLLQREPSKLFSAILRYHARSSEHGLLGRRSQKREWNVFFKVHGDNEVFEDQISRPQSSNLGEARSSPFYHHVSR